eukprot:scaffold43673_cov60-Phaeocystis_antarctica.AAC.4
MCGRIPITIGRGRVAPRPALMVGWVATVVVVANASVFQPASIPGAGIHVPRRVDVRVRRLARPLLARVA